MKNKQQPTKQLITSLKIVIFNKTEMDRRIALRLDRITKNQKNKMSFQLKKIKKSKQKINFITNKYRIFSKNTTKYWMKNQILKMKKNFKIRFRILFPKIILILKIILNQIHKLSNYRMKINNYNWNVSNIIISQQSFKIITRFFHKKLIKQNQKMMRIWKFKIKS